MDADRLRVPIVGGDAVPVARYFLARASQESKQVSNLKMQKLVYYGYCGFLVHTGKKLFNSRIEAWANGPVVPPLYGALKEYGYSPIPEAFLCGHDLPSIEAELGDQKAEILSNVFVRYGGLAPLQLVLLTHSECPWLNARQGVEPTERSKEPIKDQDILATYSEDDFVPDANWLLA